MNWCKSMQGAGVTNLFKSTEKKKKAPEYM
jgi:hypothetical protein